MIVHDVEENEEISTTLMPYWKNQAKQILKK
jgi:hypothetical protein